MVATGYGSIDTAITCMRRGAYDFIHKPYHVHELCLLLKQALEKSRLRSLVGLYEVSHEMLGILELLPLIRSTGDMCGRVLRSSVVALMLQLEHEGEPRVYLFGADGDLSSIPALMNLANVSMLERKPIHLSGEEARKLANHRGVDHFGCALMVPFSLQEKPLGAIAVLRSRSLPVFSALEVQRGVAFGTQFALALQNALRYRSLAGSIPAER